MTHSILLNDFEAPQKTKDIKPFVSKSRQNTNLILSKVTIRQLGIILWLNYDSKLLPR
jgi:hypothetical protein